MPRVAVGFKPYGLLAASWAGVLPTLVIGVGDVIHTLPPMSNGSAGTGVGNKEDVGIHAA